MNFSSYTMIVLCGLFVAGSSTRRRSDGYRCPKNVSETECQNYQCPPNSELVECVNFCNTCEDGKVCIDYCLPGCNCKAGYFRDLKGACVRKAQCPCPKKISTDVDVDEGREDSKPGCNNLQCYNSCRRKGTRGGRCIIGECKCIRKG